MRVGPPTRRFVKLPQRRSSAKAAALAKTDAADQHLTFSLAHLVLHP